MGYLAMAIVDTDTKSLIINQLSTDQLKELQEEGSIEDGQVYVVTDPLYRDLSNIKPMATSKALATDGNGKIIASSTTSTELEYVHGVTSAIQTQLNAKASTSDMNTKAPLNSPALTGTPTAPTAAVGTNSTQIATTAFVKTAVSNATPGVDNVTIETFNNSAASGGSDHDLRLKDNGITVPKIATSSLTMKDGENKANATLPTMAKVQEMVSSATSIVDNETVSYNANSQLQAIGTINKNDSTALYNWRGTLAEYNAGVSSGYIQDDWVCYITDDFTPGVTYAGEIVTVTKTFDVTGNHLALPEECHTKNFITVFQDRVFVYPSEYTLDDDFLGITFSRNISIGSTITVNFFRGIPESKIDELIQSADTINPDNYVTTKTTQMVTGVKTFSNRINVPTTTDDDANSLQAVNVKYLYDKGYSAIRTNLVTSISSQSTDAQYPSAKCVYDLVGNIEALLSEI